MTGASGSADHRSRVRGAFLGVVVGDALGAPFEGHPGVVPAERIADLERNGVVLRFTDDTAMTVALAESLLAAGGLDQDRLAATFAQHYLREPDRGYGAGTARLLADLAAGADWRPAAAGQFGGQGSFGNGAAMRVAPVAVHAAAGGLRRVAELARRSAVVTHTHPAAVDGAVAQATAIALALEWPATGPLDRRAFLATVVAAVGEGEMAEALRSVSALVEAGEPASPRAVATRTGTGVAAAESVPAALAAFLCHPGSFADTVRFAISLGGDTDTIASMAAAVAGARLGEEAVPARWRERSEGAPLLVDLADRLADRSAGEAGAGEAGSAP
jgi:poly(ADP-ribose) glycohydrolase ARH3